MPSAPYATTAGTQRYADRFHTLAADYFRPRYGLTMSSIGLGSYLGNAGTVSGVDYPASVEAALTQGCNVIDTAINYRHMLSEQEIGLALERLFTRGTVQRDEVIVCTKGGLVPFEGTPPSDLEEYIRSQFYETNLAMPMELVGHAHCMTPAYLRHQIRTSLENLGLETIDVYYLHNPEFQLAYVTPEEFRKRLQAAFQTLEEEAAAGRIRFYGISTWDGLRVAQTDRNYLPLSLLVEIAEQVGGAKHRFRFLQFPYNLGMLEAVTDSNQRFQGERNGRQESHVLPLLAAARQYALVAVASATLAQGRLLGKVPADVKPVLGNFQTDAQYCIHFNRSTPGLTTTLVGMGSATHVIENLAVAQAPALDAQTFFGLF